MYQHKPSYRFTALLHLVVCLSIILSPVQAAVNPYLPEHTVTKRVSGEPEASLAQKTTHTFLQTSSISIQNNNIENNQDYGLYSEIPITAENNWWGDASGPTHTSNPGGLGDSVSDNVDFDPWRSTFVNIGIPYLPPAAPGTITLAQNSFEENGTYGVESSIPLSAEYNWWGHPSGPYHPDTNPDGQGNAVSDSVDYEPWLVMPPGERQPSVPIALGQLITGTVRPLGYVDYHLTITAGLSLLVEVVPLDGVNALWVYGLMGEIPLWTRYDHYTKDQTSRGTYELLISPTQARTYYFSVYGRDVSETGGDYRIRVTALEEYLSDVSPNSAGNAGESMLRLSGLGFVEDMEVELRAAGLPTLVADEVILKSPTELWTSFDLTAASPGVYSVYALWPGGTEKSLTTAFTITQGIGPQLEASLVAPERVRPDRDYVLWLRYANTGDADLRAPLFIVSSPDSVPMRLSTRQPYEDKPIQVLGLGLEGYAGRLSPGMSGEIPIYFRVPSDASAHQILDFNLETMVADATPIDWEEIETEVRPSDINADLWTAMWTNFTTQIGDTWADYLDVLDDQATYLAQYGSLTYDVQELLTGAMSRVSGAYWRTTLAWSQDAFAPAPSMPLAFERIALDVFDQRYTVGAFGRGWSHNYEYTLTRPDDDTAIVQGPGGIGRRFIRDENDLWQPSTGDYGVLEQLGDSTYYLQEKDGMAWSFDATGRLAYFEEPNGNRITLSYTDGQLTSLVHSNGQSFILEYNVQGRVSRLTNHAGRVTEYTYDASGEYLLNTISPGDIAISYTYILTPGLTAEHALETITFPDGTHQYYAYDAQGHLASQWRDNDVQRTDVSYDTLGTVYVTDASDAVSVLRLGTQGQPMQVQDPLGNLVHFQIDEHLNLSHLTTPSGGQADLVYDSRGNTVEVEDALGHSTTMGYATGWNRLDWLRDAKDNLTDFAYDNAGNLTAITYPDGSFEVFGYDTVGNVNSVTNRRGNTILFTYNAAGQVTRKDYPDGRWVTYTYDPIGRITAATDLSDTTTLDYDDRGFLTRIEYPSGHWFTFDYNDAGRRTRRVSDDGFMLNYTYDVAGRLERMTDGDGTQLVRYEYDSSGRLATEWKGNGTYTTYQYDAAGQVTSMVNYAPDHTVQSYFDYTYDANGDRTSLTTLEGTTAYEYDAVGQLVGVTYPDGHHVSYEYDATGNRVSMVDDGVTTDYTANNVNQYSQVGDVTYTYDADGNMTSKTDTEGITTYEYDIENRLIRVTTPTSGTWEYTYDAFGNRVAVTHDGIETRYVHDPEGMVDVAAEYDSSGVLLARYAYGFGLVARVDSAGDLAYYAFDATGNTRQLSDSAGAVANSYDYSPFGISLEASETISNPFHYVGRFGVINEGNGLVFMRARYYDKDMGRFITPDPIGLLGGDSNLYSYVKNNPLSTVDPEGTVVNIGLAAAGAVIGGTTNAVITWVTSGGQATKGQIAGALVSGAITGGAAGFTGGFSLLAQTGVAAGAGYTAGAISYSIEKAIDHTSFIGKDLIKESIWSCATNVLSLAVGKGLEPSVAKGRWGNFSPGFWRTLGALNKHGKDLWVHQWADSFIGNFDRLVVTLTPLASWVVEAILPLDPNEKVGVLGAGIGHAVSIDQELFYTIYFENVITATAPAQEVNIVDYLDPNLDWQTFDISEIAFGDKVIAVQEVTDQHYTQETIPDYRVYIEKDWWVDIAVQLDYLTGKVSWDFRTIDPDTGELPDDPLAGFLPPNDGTGRGEGYVVFSVRPSPEIADGTILSNVADIVFDTNDPIVTNEVTNTIDAMPPSIISTSPVADAVNVALTAPIVVTFSEQMNPLSLNVVLTPMLNVDSDWDQAGVTAIISHTGFLAESRYTVSVQASDAVGNPLVPISWLFNTTAATIPDHKVYLPLVIRQQGLFK